MAVLYAPTSKNAVQKTLSAELLSTASTGDAITFDDVDGIPNLPGVLVINRVDANGTATPSSREYISYTGTSGTTVLIETRNVDGGGSVRTHAVGSIVEFAPDVVWADSIYDTLGLIVDPSDISSLKSGVELPSPVINTGISGTAVKDEDDMASNSATALATQQSVKAMHDTGWTAITETLTYASATTITVASGAASRFQVGDKLKITQTTAKYFYITGVADTVLTVYGMGTYTVADAAITSPQLSRIERPFAFPEINTLLTVKRQGGSSTSWQTPGTTNYTNAGVIIQTGALTLNDGVGAAVTFPQAFAQSPLVFTQLNTTGPAAIALYSVSATQFSAVQGSGGNYVMNWMAIGQKAT